MKPCPAGRQELHGTDPEIAGIGEKIRAWHRQSVTTGNARTANTDRETGRDDDEYESELPMAVYVP